MATPEVRNNSIVSEQSPIEEVQDVAGSTSNDWFHEFVPLERAFFVLSGILIAGALAAYLGFWTGNHVITVIGAVAFSVGMIGVAFLAYPLIRISIRAFSDWR